MVSYKGTKKPHNITTEYGDPDNTECTQISSILQFVYLVNLPVVKNMGDNFKL